MEKKKSQRKTTEEEFSTATRLLISCRATLRCGCQFDEVKADWLYYQCKKYIEDYKKRTKK